MIPKRRILLIQTQAENAGAQEISRLVGAGLTKRGYDVHSLFFFRKTLSFDEPPNTIYGAPNRPGTPLAFLHFLWNLGRSIRRVKPDAVLTYQHYGNAIGGVISRLVSPAPVIANQVTARWTMPWLLRVVDIAMGSLGVFQRITVNSLDMEREYSGFPASYRRRMQHVAHGFDQKSTDLSKREARQQFDFPADAVLLGAVARLHPIKRHDASIRLLADRPDWHLAIAGQGPEEMPLKALAQQLGVSDRVYFIGEIAPDRIGPFLRGLDVFVFPTRAETFGLAAVEAANAGVVSVVNDLPVLREVLSWQGKPAAHFVDASDHAKLLAGVTLVLDDKALSASLRHTAEGLRIRYSVDTMVEEYVRILDQAMKSNLTAQEASPT
jgi:L-malate glycosyltransferase